MRKLICLCIKYRGAVMLWLALLSIKRGVWRLHFSLSPSKVKTNHTKPWYKRIGCHACDLLSMFLCFTVNRKQFWKKYAVCCQLIVKIMVNANTHSCMYVNVTRWSQAFLKKSFFFVLLRTLLIPCDVFTSETLIFEHARTFILIV